MNIRGFFSLFLVFSLLTSCLDDGMPDSLDSEAQLEKDILLIDEYLQNEGIEAIEDETGIRYRFLTTGSGNSPEVTDDVNVKYKGSLLSTGTVFDENQEGIVFPLNGLIACWQIILPKMKEGEKVQLFSPSRYAYGRPGSGSIPPNAVLIFEIELVEIR